MTYVPGNVCHLEIPAPDIPALQAFYGTVFGWTFQPLHARYVYFDAGNIAGALAGHMIPSDHGTVMTVLAADVQTKLQEAERAGARILQHATPVPGGRGQFGYFADPCGNRVGLWMY